MHIPYYDWIACHANRNGNRIAAIDLATDRHFTYREFDDRIARLALALRESAGVSAGDRVAILAMNTTDLYEIRFACGRLGAICVTLNWRLATPELAAIMADCTPSVLFFDQELASRARELSSDASLLKTYECGAPGSQYESLIADSSRLDVAHYVTLDDISAIIYTSGTTGSPKGVVVTHGMNFWNAINSSFPSQIIGSSVVLTVLPLFHTGGNNMLANPVFHAGGTVVLSRSFDAGEALRLLGDRQLGITHFVGVTSHYQFMMQHPAFDQTDLTGLVCGGIGGSPTPNVILSTWAERGVLLQQIYGMTETSPIVTMLDKTDAIGKAGSAGKPVVHTEVRLVGSDGVDVPLGTTGEVWIRGPNVTPGYWNNPQATQAAFTDGWFHSGDAAVADSEGYYYIVDRWKDMYISGGENVYPAEIENVLYQCPEIAEVAVIAVPDERWGEVGCAVVVLKQDAAISAEDIITLCADKLARYKLPRSVVFTDALPRNATGKVHKPTLRLQFGASTAS